MQTWSPHSSQSGIERARGRSVFLFFHSTLHRNLLPLCILGRAGPSLTPQSLPAILLFVFPCLSLSLFLCLPLARWGLSSGVPVWQRTLFRHCSMFPPRVLSNHLPKQNHECIPVKPPLEIFGPRASLASHRSRFGWALCHSSYHSNGGCVRLSPVVLYPRRFMLIVTILEPCKDTLIVYATDHRCLTTNTTQTPANA